MRAASPRLDGTGARAAGARAWAPVARAPARVAPTVRAATTARPLQGSAALREAVGSGAPAAWGQAPARARSLMCAGWPAPHARTRSSSRRGRTEAWRLAPDLERRGVARARVRSRSAPARTPSSSRSRLPSAGEGACHSRHSGSRCPAAPDCRMGRSAWQLRIVGEIVGVCQRIEYARSASCGRCATTSPARVGEDSVRDTARTCVSPTRTSCWRPTSSPPT